NGRPDGQRAGIRLLLSDDHLEQRRLARAVRPDDADDAAAGQSEGEAVDQDLVAERLLQIPRRHDVVAEPGWRRNHELVLQDLLGRLLRRELFVLLNACLALGLSRARRETHPLELALERALAGRFRFLFRRETRLLLAEPGRVVPLVRNAVASIQLED